MRQDLGSQGLIRIRNSFGLVRMDWDNFLDWDWGILK